MNEFCHQICKTGHFDYQLNQRHEWLLLGAKVKANSVIQLTKGLNIRDILEIGSATGALLETLDQLGFAEKYYALEPSETLHRYMVKRNSISRLSLSEPATTEKCNLKDRWYNRWLHAMKSVAFILPVLILLKTVILSQRMNS